GRRRCRLTKLLTVSVRPVGRERCMSADFIIHWPYLIVAAIMLWFPRQWLRMGKRLFRRRRRHKDKLEQFAENRTRDPEDKSVRLGLEIRTKRNWMDLGRVVAGTLCLVHFAFEVVEPSVEARRNILFLQVFV